jgi:hypothetical protein
MRLSSSTPIAGVAPLTFTAHSGFGVQVQALTAAVFLANATGRALVVPPWLLRNNVTSLVWDPHTLLSRKCKSQDILTGHRVLTRLYDHLLCDSLPHAHTLNSFSSVYDLDALVKALPWNTRPAVGDECTPTRRGGKRNPKRKGGHLHCPIMDLETHLHHVPLASGMVRSGWRWSNTGMDASNPDCDQAFVHLWPSESSCERLLQAIADAGRLLNGSTRSALCVGPLNDWLFQHPCTALWLEYRDKRRRPEKVLRSSAHVGRWKVQHDLGALCVASAGGAPRSKRSAA